MIFLAAENIYCTTFSFGSTWALIGGKFLVGSFPAKKNEGVCGSWHGV
jgi:hypothetical protein